jgi:DNA-binding transcriptional MerR regulator
MDRVVKKDRIDSMFDRIKILTALLLENFSIEQFQEIMQERSSTVTLLKREIENEKEQLMRENKLYQLDRKINTYLTEIKEMDAKIVALIKSKMDDIRFEMCSLTKRGSAAMAYTSHKRT